MFDNLLNPVAATVALGMEVVSYSNVDSANPDFNLFVAYQTQLEVLSRVAQVENAVGAASNLLGVL
jgi:hypothetical protein